MAKPAVTITVYFDDSHASVPVCDALLPGARQITEAYLAQCRIIAIEAVFAGGEKYRFFGHGDQPTAGLRARLSLLPGSQVGFLAMFKLAQSFLGEHSVMAEFIFKFEPPSHVHGSDQ